MAAELARVIVDEPFVTALTERVPLPNAVARQVYSPSYIVNAPQPASHENLRSYGNLRLCFLEFVHAPERL
jgi:hypothetical protein